ncbi:hypothetical protein [Shewanella baltica]|uniref:hypothetical protein n=1 Tax=Shewanella baltica TaxID=62322 RepID=UPI00217F122F|nr:hypothetical protein [Shewanella baltica]MCS6175377.1 hypothetical protein [Shewanella baltica]
MKTFSFSLVLDGVNSNTPHLEDALFEAGCDDALVCFYGNTVYLEFDREAESFHSAILSAIKAIENSGIGAKVISVDAGDYVGISDISTLSSITKQSIALLKDGKRGAGNFPNPVLRLTSQQPLWRWGDVANWLANNHKIDNELARNAETVEAFNLALELREPRKCDEILTLTHALQNQRTEMCV